MLKLLFGYLALFAIHALFCHLTRWLLLFLLYLLLLFGFVELHPHVLLMLKLLFCYLALFAIHALFCHLTR
ncbi:membrane protein [Candidatus Omnitrophus magneticus]|uniref:Membrane protein n=1 Tax=Candidatus Omnitrophus magneticus TaxID=1609969 RepID=A0A0F0CMB1_9BACT|nr:membrane protein [Candidatus Omnitrophus magneticus]